jgi:hypothetical protein
MTYVDPDAALAAMTTIWREFGNEVSPPLLAAWRTMCNALNEAGQGSVGWTALAMPTGVGKTQFAALYCALMPNPALTVQNIRTFALHPGVLFVTRLISEANKFVERVNKLAGRKIAAAYYRNSPLALEEAARFPVLAITHAACERHQRSDASNAIGETVWEQLMRWHDGGRGKVIIDETPNFIMPVQINSTWLGDVHALRWFPNADMRLYVEIEALLYSITDPRLAHKSRAIDAAEFELINRINVGKIREHLASLDDYALALNCSKGEDASSRDICERTLSSIEALQRNAWAWLSWRGQTAQINSASLHPSLSNGSGVILDATAPLYLGYDLLSPTAKVVKAPPNVRRYDNVTLHVARGHRAGKGYVTEHAEKLWPQYRAALQAALPNGERVLVCTHKEFREKVDVAPLPRISFAHYGEIDGRNDWANYEAVALLGLPYLDNATPANVAQALLGAQTTEWLQSASARRTSTHCPTSAPMRQI